MQFVIEQYLHLKLLLMLWWNTLIFTTYICIHYLFLLKSISHITHTHRSSVNDSAPTNPTPTTICISHYMFDNSNICTQQTQFSIQICILIGYKTKTQLSQMIPNLIFLTNISNHIHRLWDETTVVNKWIYISVDLRKTNKYIHNSH